MKTWLTSIGGRGNSDKTTKMTMTGKYSEGVRRETDDEMNERYE
jgi:hypothetical protein